ncbi:MAG: hypothetical protein AAF585_08420 [Verrucomicrobiota bacterium]
MIGICNDLALNYPKERILMEIRTFIFLSTLAVAASAAAEPPTDEEVQIAVEKGLFFVEKTAMKWWKTKKCSSCHEGPILMVSYNIA